MIASFACRVARRLLPIVLLAGCVCLPAGTAAARQGATPPAGSRNVAVDPIRCWWRPSTGAVHIGERFEVVLTCAVLDNEAVQVVPDESRLASTTVSLQPFEVLDGSHPADLRSGARRFFQYRYITRIINRDAIGGDISLPPLEIHYRVTSRLPGNSAVQGRDLTYLLPPESIRVLSIVPQDALDIRDGSDQNFGAVEALGFRAGVLEIIAITLIALGAVMVIVAIVRLFAHARRGRPVGQRVLSEGVILRLAGRELTAVKAAVDGEGWTDAQVARALAATRVAAAAILDRPISQRRQPAADTSEGRMVLRRRRRPTVAFSSPVTADHVTHALAQLPIDTPPARRQALEEAHAVLAAFGVSQYGRGGLSNRDALDQALARAVLLTQRVAATRRWPAAQMRRWSQQREAERQS